MNNQIADRCSTDMVGSSGRRFLYLIDNDALQGLQRFDMLQYSSKINADPAAGLAEAKVK